VPARFEGLVRTVGALRDRADHTPEFDILAVFVVVLRERLGRDGVAPYGRVHLRGEQRGENLVVPRPQASGTTDVCDSFLTVECKARALRTATGSLTLRMRSRK
jgi:hypothetical protein